MLQSTAGWKHSPAELSQVNPHVIIWATFAVIPCITSNIIARKPSEDLIAMCLRLIPLHLTQWRVLKFPSLLTSRQGRSWCEWRPTSGHCPSSLNVVHQALQVLPTLLCAATPYFCRHSSAVQTPLSRSRAAALGLAVSWLQRRVITTLDESDEKNIFPCWNRFEAESRSI